MLIREGRWSEIDQAHVAEELEDIGKRDRREVLSRMTVLTMHMRKLEFQPEKMEGSTWSATVTEQRRQWKLILKDLPSLKRFADENMSHVYEQARQDVTVELVHLSRDPSLAKCLVFLEDYGIEVARDMVQGVDVWLNTLRRGEEACGTSAKANINGVLSTPVRNDGDVSIRPPEPAVLRRSGRKGTEDRGE